MNPFSDISTRLREALPDDAVSTGDRIAVRTGLRRALLAESWSSADRDFINRISKKLDTTRRLYETYSHQWTRVSSDEIDEPWRSVLAATLCNALYVDLEKDSNDPQALKRLNVAWKAIDYLDAVSPGAADEFRSAMQALDFTFEAGPVTATPFRGAKNGKGDSTILPLTVLFSEGPIARAYLETIASLGLRPRKIVHLVSSVDVATRKPVLPWLPAVLRKSIAAGIERSRMFHWPDAIARRYPAVVASILREVAEKFEFAEEVLRQAQLNKPLVEYSPSVDTLLVNGLKDPDLLDYLGGQAEKEFLYTGGGIVPPGLLDLPGSRFIHVHPGYLPDIRGADGLLWSVLMSDRPSASAFYMAPGIDTGDILITRWLPEINIPVDAAIDLATRYRMAYAFIDPWVRCCVLRELLVSQAEFGDIPATGQAEAEGCTYHFMHDHLRSLALQHLLPEQ